MLRLTREQRHRLAETLPDTANLVIGACWFGQLLGERPFSYTWAAIGIFGYLILVAWSLKLQRDGRDE
jgi:hypothetical protein